MIFEDPHNGAVYWLEAFNKFPNMKYYAKKEGRTVNIDFEDNLGLASSSSSSEQQQLLL
jgi:hypothetical protein